MAYSPDPYFHKVIIWAEDIDSLGTFRAVQGQFDTNGNFVLLTNGTGGGGGGGGTGTWNSTVSLWDDTSATWNQT